MTNEMFGCGGHFDDVAPGCVMFIVVGFLALLGMLFLPEGFPFNIQKAPKSEVYWIEQEREKVWLDERLQMRLGRIPE